MELRDKQARPEADIRKEMLQEEVQEREGITM